MDIILGITNNSVYSAKHLLITAKKAVALNWILKLINNLHNGYCVINCMYNIFTDRLSHIITSFLSLKMTRL